MCFSPPASSRPSRCWPWRCTGWAFPAVSLTGAQAGIVTDRIHTKAKILNITPKKVFEHLDSGHVVIVAGFQGQNEEGHITTLGRGGSDLTAIAMAAALKADICEIYTDVDGVYTADPRLVPNAKKIDEISYDEMLELASLGAKVDAGALGRVCEKIQSEV